MVTVIIGLSVLGVVELLTAGSMANADSTELTIAVNLANNMAERIQGATYSTLFATYDNQTYSPPIDNRGTSLSSFSTWSQSVDVKYLTTTNLTQTLADNNVTDMARVTVTISHNSAPIYTTSWIAVAP